MHQIGKDFLMLYKSRKQAIGVHDRMSTASFRKTRGHRQTIYAFDEGDKFGWKKSLVHRGTFDVFMQVVNAFLSQEQPEQ